MFSRTEVPNSTESWSRIETWARTEAIVRSRRSSPPRLTLPSQGSTIRRIMLASVDFPAPEGPSTAQCWPAGMVRVIPLSTAVPVEVAGPDVVEHDVRVRALERDGVR